MVKSCLVDPEALISPSHIYIDDARTWLRECSFQSAIAFCVLITGLVSAWGGPGFWRKFFTISFTVVAAGIARYEALEWEFDIVSEVVLMVLVAFSIALATYVGFEGFQRLVGAVVGGLVAYNNSSWLRDKEQTANGPTLLWCAVGTLFAVLAMSAWQKPILATATPLFGSFLAVSAAGCLLSRVPLVGELLSDAPWAVLPPPDRAWIDAAEALLAGHGTLSGHGSCALLAAVLHGGNKDRQLPAVLCLIGTILVTAFAAITGIGFEDAADKDSQWPILGCFLWALLATVAAWVQLGKITPTEGVDLPRDLSNSFNSLRALKGDRYRPISQLADPRAESSHGQSNGQRAKSMDKEVDSPGYYIISHNPTYVSPTITVPICENEIADTLSIGTTVKVLEVARSDCRVRARISQPEGWISLVDNSNGLRFATRFELW